MRYVRPKSLSWWAGVLLVAMGVAQAAGWPSEWVDGAQGVTGVMQALMGAVGVLTGAGSQYAPPGVMIATGLGMIGIRDAIARDSADREDLADYRYQSTMDAVAETAAGRYAALSVDDGDSPLPPGVIDPWGEGGSRS